MTSPMSGPSEYAWRYRCSICKELVAPEDVTKHTAEERAKPTWPGAMSYSRVDSEEATS